MVFRVLFDSSSHAVFVTAFLMPICLISAAVFAQTQSMDTPSSGEPQRALFAFQKSGIAGNAKPVKVVPQFLTADLLDVTQVQRISLFRSSAGHDYSFAGEESCRSKKHYFTIYPDADWSKIIVFAPVTGQIARREPENPGTKIEIVPTAYPDWRITIFHISAVESVQIGNNVRVGQPLGTLATNNTDIAVLGPDDLYSYFEVISDGVFAHYEARGAQSRQDFIIPEELRDSDPLECDGQAFLTVGTLPQWYFFDTPSEGEGGAEGVFEGEGGEEGGGGEEGEAGVSHSADSDRNHRISLVELLRVIQFLNSGGFRCAIPPAASEDGFLPGDDMQHDCPPHSSDYNPQDWQISLPELLRLIQIRNSTGYYSCPGEETEDGFCLGLGL